ncbi:hypothetical protein ACLOJK_039432 [Asimina triloba]
MNLVPNSYVEEDEVSKLVLQRRSPIFDDRVAAVKMNFQRHGSCGEQEGTKEEKVGEGKGEEK